jgi:hypothetical protein
MDHVAQRYLTSVPALGPTAYWAWSQNSVPTHDNSASRFDANLDGTRTRSPRAVMISSRYIRAVTEPMNRAT